MTDVRGVLLLVLAPLACARSAAPVAVPASPQPPCELLARAPRSEAGRADLERCRLAAEASDVRAAFILSQVLRDNPALPGANERGRWLMRAAELGHPVAQYDLAKQFMSMGMTSGVRPIDRRDEALQLLRNSGCGGYPPALEALRAANYPLDPAKCPPPVEIPPHL